MLLNRAHHTVSWRSISFFSRLGYHIPWFLGLFHDIPSFSVFSLALTGTFFDFSCTSSNANTLTLECHLRNIIPLANLTTSCSSVHHHRYCFLPDCCKKSWMNCVWAFRHAAHTFLNWFFLCPCVLFNHALPVLVNRWQLIYGWLGSFTNQCVMSLSLFEAWWCATEAYALFSQDIVPWSYF